MSVRIHRHFVEAGSGRRVHYRMGGSGPPLVMLHGSPGDSEMLLHEITAAAAHFTVIALDTPGLGFSEVLPGETLTVRDLAAATAEAMTAMGLPPCRVYGTHTGAAIGIELGVGWPEMVTGLLLEGLPIFTEAEIGILFRDYFAPMVPDALGGHLTSTWMRFRDQFTWFPWNSRDVTRLNPYGRPAPEDIHVWVSMFYRGCKTYGPAYRAACTYGQAALRAAEALHLPTETDMLHPHLQRLPSLRPQQHVATLPTPLAEKCAMLIDYARLLPGGEHARPTPPEVPIGTDPGMMFIDAGGTDILVRTYGHAGRPALMIAHDAPGSGLSCEGLARSLAGQFHVIVPDLPGCGESGLSDVDGSVLQAAANSLRLIADRLGLEHFFVLGIGCGAALAAVLAHRNERRLRALLLMSPVVPDATAAVSIAPDLPLSAEGGHWVRAWLTVRDGQIYQPWYDGSVAAQRRDQGNFNAQWLHDQTCALMAGRETYQCLPREACAFDTLAAVRRATVPVHVLASCDGASRISEILLRESVSA
jgi:pimeloyl-ACP methyl ester carboxylesterase